MRDSVGNTKKPFKQYEYSRTNPTISTPTNLSRQKNLMCTKIYVQSVLQHLLYYQRNGNEPVVQ
jgi:hypothetical protein